jgi:putative DNA primase/helicase
MTGRKAQSNNPATWCDYQTAKSYAARGDIDGLGFMFDKASGIFGIDVDNCVDESGQFTPVAQEIIHTMQSYTEMSPSGKGVHILAKGTLPPSGRRKANVEMYDSGRFFTVTGQHVPGTPLTIENRTNEVAVIHYKYIASPQAQPESGGSYPQNGGGSSDTELITKITKSKQGPEFARLWSGDTSRYGGDVSAADLAICNILAFWTGRDAGRMDNFFRQSGLYRTKWDEQHFADGRTYGQATIAKAIADCRTVYGEGMLAERKPRTEHQQLPTKEYRLFPYTDLGNAERLIYAHGDNIKYCPELKLFLIWDGRRWLKDITGEIDRIAFKAVRFIKKDVQHTDNPKIMEACISWAKSSESRAKLQNMIELSKVQQGVPISINELDQGKYLVNCLNGTIDLKNGKLLPHNKNHYITHCLPFEFRPFQEGQAARWVQFLCEITNNELSIMRYLWKLTGLCLSGDVSEHVLNIFYGSKGRNGKGLFLEIIQEILGELATVLPFASFEPKNASAIPCDIASMVGKRLVVAQESNEGKRLDEALIKSLTGGDRLTGRFMRCDLFTFKPTHKIIMSTNNKPVIRETSNAIWSRLRLVPFEVSFEGREDRQLIDKLKNELSEIFSWMVAGFSVWQSEGLEAPERIKELCKEYRASEDTIQIFIDECCFINSQVSSPAKNIYDAFVTWAERNGEKALPRKLFYSRLESRGFDKYPSMGVARFRGISLLDIRNRTG